MTTLLVQSPRQLNVTQGSVSGAHVTEEKEQLLFQQIQMLEPCLKKAVQICLFFLEKYDVEEINELTENREKLLFAVNEILVNPEELDRDKAEDEEPIPKFHEGQAVWAYWKTHWVPAKVQGPGPDGKFFVLLNGYEHDGQYLLSEQEIKPDDEVTEDLQRPTSPTPVNLPIRTGAPIMNSRPQLTQAQLYHYPQMQQNFYYQVPQSYVPQMYYYTPQGVYRTRNPNCYQISTVMMPRNP